MRKVTIPLTALGLCTALLCSISTPVHAGEEQKLTCDSAYRTAMQLDNESSVVPTKLFQSFIAYNLAEDWKNVALLCPTHYAEGIIKSSLNAASATHIPQFLQTDQTVLTNLDDFSTVDGQHTETVHAATLQSMAQAEDRLRFSYETLAARDPDNGSLIAAAQNASTNSQTLADAARTMYVTHYSDTRERIYATDNLDASENAYVTDGKTGISMSLRASLELDTALDELEALNNDFSQQSVTASSLSDISHRSDQSARLVQAHLLRAFSAGAPQVIDLYLQ